MRCRPFTRENLGQAFPGRKHVRLTFFASWCQSCKEHLDSAEALVGVFDDADRIERVIATLGLQQPCFIDAGLARELGVEGLPIQKTIELD